jgi:DNA-binding transcriptional ArsR family regulator
MTRLHTGRPRRRTPADIFTAIADPSRRRIVELLATRQLSVNEVARTFEVSRPAVSKHLRILKEAGVVADDVVGRERLYRLQPNALDEVASWIATYQRFWRDRVSRLARTTKRLADERHR